MGFRFRRSIKIAPGVRWNFGKKSTSLTIGPRGAKMTIGTKGTRVTTGIPGTALSYTQYNPSTRARRHRNWRGLKSRNRDRSDAPFTRSVISPSASRCSGEPSC